MQSTVEKIYQIIEFKIKSLDQFFTAKIPALATPQISGTELYKLPDQIRELKCSHKMEMADACSEKNLMSVAMLIGSDLFCDLF